MKGQQMMETIAVLLIFIILFGLGLVFYGKFQSDSAQGQKTDDAMIKAIKASQAILSMPELQCTSNNVVLEGCVDYTKLSQFKLSETTFFDALGTVNINVTIISPIPNPRPSSPAPFHNSLSYNLYDKKLDKYTRKTTLNIPVVIYNPLERSAAGKSFGYLVVEAYVN